MRLSLFEFEDLRYSPQLLRTMITDFLSFQYRFFGLHNVILRQIQSVLKRTGQRRVIEYCAGSAPLAEALGDMGEVDELLLCDLYPRKERFEHLERNNPKIRCIPEAVDVLDGEIEGKGLRLMISSFHHFAPRDARNILIQAVKEECPFLVFECTERRCLTVVQMLIVVPLVALLASPFMKPFCWKRLVFTYLLPVFPAVLCWDGLVSCLRTYTLAEMKELTKSADTARRFHWELGILTTPSFGIRVPYLVGIPV